MKDVAKLHVAVVLCKVSLACVASKPIVKSTSNIPRFYGGEIIPIMMDKIYRECTL